MSISVAKLGDVAEFIRGITFKPDDVVPLDSDDAVVCMRTKNVQELLDCDHLLAIPSQFVRRKDQYLKEGDILVSSANSWNLVGKCCWIPSLPWPATFGGFISVLRADLARVDRRYLYWWFASDHIQALLRSFGQKTTNISNLNIERCRQLELPLPPLPEQRRIAAILDQAGALRAKRQETLAQLDSLTQSIFIEMFGAAEKNPRGWPTRSLRELGRVVTGRTPPSSKEGMFGGNIPFITPGDLDSEEAVSRTVTDAGAAEVELVRAGSTLVCCIGTIGKMRMANTQSAFNQQINAVEWYKDIDDDFGLTALGFFKKILTSRATLTTVPILNKSNFEKLEIPVPPKELQRDFSKRLESLRGIRKNQVSAIDKIENLFASLQHRAFRGEL